MAKKIKKHDLDKLQDMIADWVDQRPADVWKAYQNDGLPLSQYVTDVLLRCDFVWISENLYSYLSEDQVLQIAEDFLVEYLNIEYDENKTKRKS